MPTTVVQIGNARLDEDAHDFRSVTEFRDMPRKTECLDEAQNALYGTDPGFPCQDGCGEAEFQYIVEPGDKIPLQFQLIDMVNPDPMNPEVGWREDTDQYLVGLEILDMDGNVLWEGDTNEVSDEFSVWGNEDGTFQNILINVDDVIALIDDPTVTCWYFRVKVLLALAVEYETVDAESAPLTVVPVGYTYIDFGSGQVLMWTGSEWEPQTISHLPYYVQSTGHWYQHMPEPTGWVGLAEHPEDEEAFDYVHTMTYRLRNCDEPVVRFRSNVAGRDCTGFNHTAPPAEYIMEPIDGLVFVDYWSAIDPASSSYCIPVDAPMGTTVIWHQFQSIITLTESGWVFGPIMPSGTQVLIMNDSASPWFDGSSIDPTEDMVPAGTVMTLSPVYVPFGGWWGFSGPLEDVFPGEVFTPGTTSKWAFQYDFKVLGSCEVDEMPVETEVTRNGRRLRVTPGTKAKVRTTGVPQSVARMVQNVLSAPTFWVDEQQYEAADGLRKNNNDGEMWWLDFTVTRDECTVEGSCS